MHKTSVTVYENGQGTFTNGVETSSHTFLADEPADIGGDNLGPNPYEFLLSSLGACTSMTIRMYAKRKQWPLEKVSVKLEHNKNEEKVDIIERILVLEGDDLTEEQRNRLLEIADRCSIHRMVHEGNLITNTVISDCLE